MERHICIIAEINIMPRVGRYDYPDRDLDSCLEYMRIAHDKVKDTAMRRDAFAEALNLSPKTGPFGVLIGSLAKYGLADTRDGYVRYTELAKRIMFEPTQSDEAKSEAVRNIKLFADINAKLGAQPTVEQIRIFLREHADVDTAEAPEKALEVSKIFKKVVSYFPTTPAVGERQSPKDGGEDKRTYENSRTEDSTIQPDVEDYKLGGGIRITLPKEIDKAVEAWERVKPAMDMILGVTPQKSKKENTI
jgi:hypothetical protein